jgi:hypothetical protein
MSAGPKASIPFWTADVRFGGKADMVIARSCTVLATGAAGRLALQRYRGQDTLVNG